MVANIGLGEILWSLLVIYVMIMYFMIMFTIIVDMFRSHDIGGFAKAIWAIALIFLPILTMIAYLITRGKGMAERNTRAAEAAKADTDSYIRSVAGGSASELEKAKQLHDSGAINADEYAALKAKIIG